MAEIIFGFYGVIFFCGLIFFGIKVSQRLKEKKKEEVEHKGYDQY